MTTQHDTTITTLPANDDTSEPAPVAAYKLPPSTMNIPSPPAGFVPPNGLDFRGVLPKLSELAVLTEAVEELKRLDDYTDRFGRSLLPRALVLAAIESAEQWSMTRARSAAYDAYCKYEEGAAWVEARKVIARIRPTIEAAVATEPELGAQLSHLQSLFSARRLIAKRGLATREANLSAVARGEKPKRGIVTKAKERAAAKAALAVQTTRNAAAKWPPT